MTRRPWLIVLLLWPSAISAQAGGSISADAGTLRFTRGSGSTAVALQGTVLGGTLSLSNAPLFAVLRYAQGSLTDGTTNPATPFVTGQIQVGAAPFSWLSVSAGPRALALDRSGTERWVLWEGSVRLTAPLIALLARSYVEGRRTLAADVNLPGAGPSGSGVGVGLIIQPLASPVSVSLAYQVDRDEIPGGALRTMDGLWLAVHLGTHEPR
jgi:hypothetical protein